MSNQPFQFPLATPGHATDTTTVLHQLVSSPDGLSPAEAGERLQRFGANRLTVRPGRGPPGR